MLTCSQCQRAKTNTEAIWFVWPDASPTLYDYLCTRHARQALKRGLQVRNPDGDGYVRSPVYQVSLIHSQAHGYQDFLGELNLLRDFFRHVGETLTTLTPETVYQMYRAAQNGIANIREPHA
jgi:hypothetical protein